MVSQVNKRHLLSYLEQIRMFFKLENFKPIKTVQISLCLKKQTFKKGSQFNPKRCGLFGQLRRRGGIKVSHFRIMVSGGLNFHSSYTNSTSYESWHIQLNFETLVRSLRLIVWPQEVTEVTEVKMKKKIGENYKITNFWLTET